MTTRVRAGHVPFALAQDLFYDVLGSPDDADRGAELVTHRLPPGWRRARQGPWTVLVPDDPGDLPGHGWKVHVAALPDDAADTIALTVGACLDLGVVVKALRTRRTVLASQLKHAPEWAAGKVLTAYPPTPAIAATLLDALVPLLAGRPAPRILGELAVAGAPVSLRHGAFAAGWCRDADGRLRPGWTEAGRAVIDLRGPAGAATAPPVPRELRRFVDITPGPRLDVSDVALLHRTNGGAVYRARWRGERVVVLKEGRRHAGLDQGGADALTRLHHEHEVLRRLSGTGLVPEVIDLVHAGDSDFLVMEHVAGRTLCAGLAAAHPGCRPGAGPQAGRDYSAWVERCVRTLRDAVHALADHGVVHGDLHPGNVVELPDRLVLLDLESAALDGRSVARGVAVPGFSSGLDPTPDGDLAAVERIRLSLLNPLAGVLVWRPELAEDLLESGGADVLGLPAPAALRHETPQGTSARLVAGITAAASPGRTDRLFPGDVAQFTVPGAALGLLHGAAGVCLALAAAGAHVEDAWLDWLAEAAVVAVPAGGLGHGLEGVALALAVLGRRDEARAVGARAADASADATLPPWWEYGHAGRALAFAELARLVGPEFDGPARAHLQATIDAVATGPAAPGTGLLAGWTGVALALTAASDLLPRLPRKPPLSVFACRAAAWAALARELPRARLVDGALFLADGGRVLPSLAVGGAGLGLAAAALLDRDPDGAARLDGALAGSAGDLPDPFGEALGGAVATGLAQAAALTCRAPVVMSAGLALGRSGLIAVLRRIAGDGDPAVAEHVRRLDWHVVGLDRTPRPGAPVPPARTGPAALLGEAALRLSTDLATGSAGALLALLPGSVDPLHAVLRLPAAVPVPSAPTPVTTVSTAR